MAALRSSLAALIGQRYPASVLVVTLSHDAKPIEQPATTPWREAQKQLAPNVTTWLVAR